MTNTKKILVVVEGEKEEPRILNYLLNLYGIDSYNIFSYKTNIYALYQDIAGDPDWQLDDFDIRQVLRAREKDSKQRELLSNNFSDIILVFDFEPQDPLFDIRKIKELQGYFAESTDMGKLYLNYPMVEAFYHMKSLPDSDYLARTVSFQDIINHKYKQIVNDESKSRNCKHFICTKEEASILIRQNLEKALFIQQGEKSPLTTDMIIDALQIAVKQSECINQDQFLYVLCTMVFFIFEYDFKLIF